MLTSIRSILRTLTDISVHGVEIQLKILQTVLPLLTNYRSVHDDILAEALLICFRLQDSKIVVVNNTAAATLRQLVIFVFDKVAKEDALALKEADAKHEVELSTGETIKLHPCAKDAYYLFQDLSLLTSNDPPEYLRLGHISKTFGLELIESVLTNHYALFRAHKELSSLLRERVCPLIIKNFSERHEFPQTMRLTRVVYILIKQFSEILIMECEIFLSMFVKILEPENPHWQRVLAMEIFRGVCADSVLLCSIYKWYDSHDSSTDVFRDMITAFGRLATEKPQLIGATQGGRESIDYAAGPGSHTSYYSNAGFANNDLSGPSLSSSNSTMRIQCIDQLDKADPPPIPETYIFYLALVCLNSIADGLAGFALPRFSPGNGRSLSSSTRAKMNENQRSATSETPKADVSRDETVKKDLLLVTDMANVAWPGLLASMSFYLSANLDEELFQGTMRSYQNFTNVCGMLDLVVPRDAFLTNLCKNAIPANPMLSSGFFSGKNTGSTTSIATTATTSLAISYTELSAQQQQILSNITLSDKNLYSLRILLNIAMFLGSVLGSSWYLVLETLQQADFLLFNRPTPKGSANTANPTGNSQAIRRTLSNSPGSGTGAGSPNPNTGTQPAPNQLMEADHAAVILASLNRLFENSKYLDDKAFIAFATALCRLSAEASGIPFKDNEKIPGNKSSRAKLFNTKSFAIEKLRYISTLDMARLMSPDNYSGAWDLIMSHLIATANNSNTPSSIRTQCCEAIADIVIIAMNYILSEHKEAAEQLQTRLLRALDQCINYIPPEDDLTGPSDGDRANVRCFSEVQKMGLETLNKILETSGHSFTCGWGLIFEMLRHVTTNSSNGCPEYSAEYDSDYKAEDADDRGERASIDTTNSSLLTAGNAGGSSTVVSGSGHGGKSASGLIKVAFASLQLICTDFLSLLSADCLRQCIATLGSFSTQSDDLNISLTAVGLLWNLSDFLQTKRLDTTKDGDDQNHTIEKDSLNIDQPITNDEQSRTYSILWMLLLLQLSHTCTDWRPEVRNGANQTLFRTIIMNGNVLSSHLWNACVWDVLFPLLDSVKMSAIRAAKLMQSGKSPLLTPSAERDASGFMLHHSRDTADKQWDETKDLVLTGISGIFRDFLSHLHKLANFKQAWSLLLAHLEDSCLRSSQEVSLASIKSFKNILTLPSEFEISQTVTSLWRDAWSSWKIIGNGIVAAKEGRDTKDYGDERKNSLEPELHSLTLSLFSSSAAPISNDFTQDTLTAYVHLFKEIYKVISSIFDIDDVASLLSVLRNVLVYPTSPQYRADIDNLSPLQEAVLEAIQSVDMSSPGVPPLILMDLSEYMTLAFLSPQDEVQKSRGYIPPGQRKFSTVTYIALNKKCTKLVSSLFKAHVNDISLYTDGVFERIIGSYGLPMKLKYDCPPSHKYGEDKTPLWKAATTGLLDVLQIGLQTLQDFGEDVSTERLVGVWRTLVDIFEGSLLSPSTPPSSMTIEELDVDEHFDISVLSVIQADIVPYLGQPRVPNEVIQKLVHVIRESSQLYYVDQSDGHRKGESEEEKATKELAIEEETTAIDRSSDIVGTTGTIVPVMKESFAYASFKTLFSLCSAEKEDIPKVRQRIAQVTIPILLERCETILRNYTADEPLLGRCPFPRVRKDEMLFLLRQCIQLKLRKDILTSNMQDGQGMLKRLLLSGPRAHLFYLYPSLCNMIACEDPVVVELIRECLQVVGKEMELP
ncbi:hypothetical protein EC973_000598 [Apophysomyces ossiformis]|uniref:Endosomal peripheral membrane protein n=1 Tax=Apophysomyces ossiformis TaxID=679940 RepID=A0A8H7BQG0_9FUNG|nr:hypothetical protein EC973_000598 [Apophysomyces ossiformis]